MGTYCDKRGEATGMTLWRVVAGVDDRRILSDAAMDLFWSENRFLFAGPDTTFARSEGPVGRLGPAARTGHRARPNSGQHAANGIVVALRPATPA